MLPKHLQKLMIHRMEKILDKYEEDACTQCPIQPYKKEHPTLLKAFIHDDVGACFFCQYITGIRGKMPDSCGSLRSSSCPCTYYNRDFEVVSKHAREGIKKWRKENEY